MLDQKIVKEILGALNSESKFNLSFLATDQLSGDFVK